MTSMQCSFCYAPIAKPEKDGPKLAVAGANVFICRKCVGMCLDIMAESDPGWRDEMFQTLSDLRSGSG